MKRIAVDIGGTFTDCFVTWGAQRIHAKALTTHGNLAFGFNQALDIACEKLGVDREAVLAEADSVRYATTLGTNALIERKGPQVGLLITHGFESTVPISRGRGYGDGLTLAEKLDLTRAHRPQPLMPIPMIAGIRQRIDYLGHVIAEIDEDHLRRQIRELIERGAEAIVVSTINGTVNPGHEYRVREIIREEYPSDILGSIPVICAADVSGRRGEYVRTTSAVIDAFLHTIMYHAMSELQSNLRLSGYRKPMVLVHNSGGMAHLNSTDALQTVHSGPVAGIHAAEALEKHGSLGNIVATDMGGTSFDIGIVVGGGVKHYDFTPVIDRWLVTIPMVHLNTLGAGGGSIARFDVISNTIAIGPDSAGSDPGPACFNRGGRHPTVTDADLLLGYLDETNYAGGSIKLAPRRAKSAFNELCAALDLGLIDVAKLVKRRADGNMAVGIVSELGAKGYNTTDFTMLAYGGNGPMHCCGIAAAAKIDRVLVPPFSSVFAAFGAAGMTQLHIHESAYLTPAYNSSTRTVLDNLQPLNDIIESLEDKGRRDLLRQGVDHTSIRHRLELDIRYGSQTIETAVVLAKNRFDTQADILGLIAQHREDYERRFGKNAPAPETGVWITVLRVASFVEPDPLDLSALQPEPDTASRPEPVSSRACHFPGVDAPVETPVYDGHALARGVRLRGPAIVNPGETTYVIEPGWVFDAIGEGGAWITRAEGEDRP